MKFLPTEKTLKNGKTVIIREASKKDAEALLRTVSKYIIESQYLLTQIEEFNPTIRDQKQWIENLNASRNSILLIATHDKKIVGNIDLKGETRKKIKHNALLGVGILKDWQNLGLGEILMNCVIDWARQNLSLENLWLHVYSEHVHAINLYKKLGFEIVSVQKAFIKNNDGSYSDDLIMKRSVKS